ncbi:MAG: protein phosphatase 2C domain-containing protein, partial [Desulfobacterales bacterium]|nr:protein phosphatase 2C domain-containing protein [Desulfobacterales bacterium]
LRIYVVADGMGGHQAGEVASKLVADTIKDLMNRYAGGDTDTIQEIPKASKYSSWLVSGILEANRQVFSLSKSRKEYKGMGSTVSAVFVTPETLIAANVGDSPIYLIRNNEVSLLSVPHTAMAEYAAFAPAGAKPLSDKYRHVITRAMGSKETVEPDFREIIPQQDDIVVLCSDGLSDKVTPEEIMKIAGSNPPPKAGRMLVDLANERGGEDNITLIVLKITGDSSAIQAPGGSVKKAEKKQEILEPVSVEYDTDEFSGKALIKNITADGLFLETGEIFSIGQKLTLTVSDKNGENSVTANAKVVSRKPRGIELKYENLTGEQKSKIELFIGQKK